MNYDRRANTDYPVHELLAARWSPSGFADRSVSSGDLRSIFEAARWAPSSFNEQPWAYIVATREEREEFARLLSCLVEGNQAWAGRAPVLALGLARTKFTRNGKPNRHAFHDLGLATSQLVLEAGARGLAVHQMGGILPSKVREVCGIPEEYEAVTGIAIGYAADPETLPEDLRERDTSPRRRRPQREFVFRGRWGTPA